MIMGTDPDISGLVEPCASSYPVSFKWAAIVPRFPSYQLVLQMESKQQVWSKVVQRFPVVQDIVMSSRGRFGRYFVDEGVKCMAENISSSLCELLDRAFACVNTNTHNGKGFMDRLEGILAQKMAISFTSVKIPAREPPGKRARLEVKSSAMHRHFANLKGEQVVDLEFNRGQLWSNGVWEPICAFPAIEEDLLLYLAIRGGKNKSCYDTGCGWIKVYSSKFLFSKTNESLTTESGGEASFVNMVAHAVFSCSRRNGVQGISFNVFLPGFLGEFLDKKWKMLNLNMRGSGKELTTGDLLDGYGEGVDALKIPFLAPPNVEWPQFILDTNDGHGCQFGHLVRNCNEDRSEVYVQDTTNQNERAALLFECKYWKEMLDASTMKDVITGLDASWAGWEIVLVFCKELVELGAEWEHTNIGCVKVCCRNGCVDWAFQPTKEDRTSCSLWSKWGQWEIPSPGSWMYSRLPIFGVR